MAFDLTVLGEHVETCEFVFPEPPATAKIRETLRYKFAEVGKLIRYRFKTDAKGDEIILETYEHRNEIKLTDAQREAGERVRREHVWEWLDRVHDGPLPMRNSQSDQPEKLMSATEIHETWPHYDRLLEAMQQSIQEHHDPNLKALRMLRST